MLNEINFRIRRTTLVVKLKNKIIVYLVILKIKIFIFFKVFEKI